MKILLFSIGLLLSLAFYSCDETDELNPTQYTEIYCSNSSDSLVKVYLFNHGKLEFDFEMNPQDTIKIDSGKFDNFGSTLKVPYLLDSAIFAFNNGRKITQVQYSTRIFSDTINCILNSYDYQRTFVGNIENWTFTVTQEDYERAK